MPEITENEVWISLKSILVYTSIVELLYGGR